MSIELLFNFTNESSLNNNMQSGECYNLIGPLLEACVLRRFIYTGEKVK